MFWASRVDITGHLQEHKQAHQPQAVAAQHPPLHPVSPSQLAGSHTSCHRSNKLQQATWNTDLTTSPEASPGLRAQSVVPLLQLLLGFLQTLLGPPSNQRGRCWTKLTGSSFRSLPIAFFRGLTNNLCGNELLVVEKDWGAYFLLLSLFLRGF